MGTPHSVATDPQAQANRASSEPAAGFSLKQVAVVAGDATLLEDVDLTIAGGSWSALIGPSGSGKSTLLRLLNRLAEPTRGDIQWCGRPLPDYDVRELRRAVGMVVQQPQLSAGTALANLTLAARLGAVPEAEAAARRARACEITRLSDALLAREVRRLSGGERQRVALARALMLEPRALLLDEPTSALDPAAARELLNALDRLRRETRITLVMVTHRLAEVAERADHASVLDGGRIVEHGPTREVIGNPQHPTTRALLMQEGVGERAS